MRYRGLYGLHDKSNAMQLLSVALLSKMYGSIFRPYLLSVVPLKISWGPHGGNNHVGICVSLYVGKTSKLYPSTAALKN